MPLECSLTAFFVYKRVTFFYMDNCLELCRDVKYMIMKHIVPITLLMLCIASCEVLDNDISKHVSGHESPLLSLEDVAIMLASLPLESCHLHEVHDAVSSSSSNGYDEEYTMRDLFQLPGKGVGDADSKVGKRYSNPMKDLISEFVRSSAATKVSGSGTDEPEAYLEALMTSDVQIYWPYSDRWDGGSLPVITFDPSDNSDVNEGYRLVRSEAGEMTLEKVVVDEDMAAKTPVWVVNRNSDAGFKTLEMLRREDPQWGEGGGTIIVSPSMLPSTKTDSASPLRSLILKDFTMNRHYDSWFAGASEFFVKTGFVEDFTASTEAELRLFNPLVTDFMIVVKRSQVGKPQPFNAVLVTEWPEQMTHCAFMITEDDGGTRTEWKCTALVRIASKSYGLEINLPFNSRDDVVWRGQLSSRWIDANSNIVGHFGDVDLTFEVIEY